jgi:hypothetical protein
MFPRSSQTNTVPAAPRPKVKDKQRKLNAAAGVLYPFDARERVFDPTFQLPVLTTVWQLSTGCAANATRKSGILKRREKMLVSVTV